MRLPLFSSFFFFNDTATTEIYTLSLHDALPIYRFCEDFRRESFHPRPELLPFGSQQIENLQLGSGLGFLRVEPVHHAEKVEANQSSETLFVEIGRAHV